MATVWLAREDCEAGTLPPLCLRCGRPATDLVERDFSGVLGWVDLDLGWLGCGWRPKLRAPMCRRHRGHWRNRRLALWGILLALAGGASAYLLDVSLPGSRPDGPLAFGLLMCVVIGGVCLVALAATGVRGRNIDATGLRLTGVSDAFRRACRLRHHAHLPDLDRAVAEGWGERPRPRGAGDGAEGGQRGALYQGGDG